MGDNDASFLKCSADSAAMAIKLIGKLICAVAVLIKAHGLSAFGTGKLFLNLLFLTDDSKVLAGDIGYERIDNSPGILTLRALRTLISANKH